MSSGQNVHGQAGNVIDTTNLRAAVRLAERGRSEARERILGRSVPEALTGCWLWEKTRNKDGYGCISFLGKNRKAHRVSYWAFRGEFDRELTIDHLCKNKSCVNPDHLEPVTHRENCLRSGNQAALCARKLVCSKGHPFDEDNTRIRSKGAGFSRACRACEREKYTPKGQRLGRRWGK